ncbi:RsbU Serine phosphatase RsbU, regulator of sigma subunit [Burkholderiales bacterium]
MQHQTRTVKTILREQWAVEEHEPCGPFINKIRAVEDVFIVPVVDRNGAPIGLIEKGSALNLAANPLHYSVFEKRSVRMLMQDDFASFDENLSIDEVSSSLLEQGGNLSRGGFLITREGKYVGIGLNTDMLNYLVEANEEKAHALAEINSEIMDSVNYASRIQQSLLPNDDFMREHLSGLGLLWEPRDVVGGDVYWRSPTHNHCFTLVLIDCTGHGVPGSLMSMLVVTSLSRVYAENPSIRPGEALAKTGDLVRRALNQDRDDATSNDGFDAGACMVDLASQRVVFAGARTNCFVIPKTSESVIRLVGDRMALGYPSSQPHEALEEVDVPLGDCHIFAMGSDGIFDQPGGPNRRAFGPKRWIEALESNRHERADGLIAKLHQVVTDWRGQEVRRDDLSALAFSV